MTFGKQVHSASVSSLWLLLGLQSGAPSARAPGLTALGVCDGVLQRPHWWWWYEGVQAHPPTPWGPQELSGSSPKRRRAEDKDEGIGSPDIWEDEKAEDLRREMIELRQQLDKERSVRMMLEEQVRQAGGVGGGSSPSLPFFLSLLPWSASFVPGLRIWGGGPLEIEPGRYLPLGHHLCWVGGLVKGPYTVKMQL